MAADESRSTIPPEAWIPHPVSDHGDLDRPEPGYYRDLTAEQKAEWDAAPSRGPKQAAGKSRPQRSKKRRGGKKR